MQGTSRHNRLLKESEVAEQLQISEKTLQSWRLLRKGLSYVKIGSAIRYRQTDIDEYISKRIITF